jgi:hypothetical protein
VNGDSPAAFQGGFSIVRATVPLDRNLSHRKYSSVVLFRWMNLHGNRSDKATAITKSSFLKSSPMTVLSRFNCLKIKSIQIQNSDWLWSGPRDAYPIVGFPGLDQQIGPMHCSEWKYVE